LDVLTKRRKECSIFLKKKNYLTEKSLNLSGPGVNSHHIVPFVDFMHEKIKRTKGNRVKTIDPSRGVCGPLFGVEEYIGYWLHVKPRQYLIHSFLLFSFTCLWRACFS
jgi:hypothetical protein